MTHEITIHMDGIPVAKGRPRFSTRGGFPRSYTPAKTASYEGKVQYYAQQAMAGRPAIESAVRVEVYLHMPIPMSMTKKHRALVASGQLYPTKKPDADNLAKALLDGINGIVFRDDAQVVDLLIVKRYADQPSAILIVRAL